jgi:hypothetical protein
MHCSIDECTKTVFRRGYCGMHYSRVNRYGDPYFTKTAPKTPGVTAAVRKEYVIKYKLEHGCMDCGFNAHHAALQLDHRPGTVKVRDIKSGQQLGWEALLAEIAKCDVVCANCHAVRTWRRVQKDA